jgi:hypothetical protein
MMKHLHPEFQSDIYVSLEAANVQLLIGMFLFSYPQNSTSFSNMYVSSQDMYIVSKYNIYLYKL